MEIILLILSYESTFVLFYVLYTYCTVHVLSNVLSYEIIKYNVVQYSSCTKYESTLKVQRQYLRRYESTFVKRTKVLRKYFRTFVLSYFRTFVLSYLISTANSVYIYYMYESTTIKLVHVHTYEAYIDSYILPSKVRKYIATYSTQLRTFVRKYIVLYLHTKVPHTYHSYPYLRMYESTSIQATSGNSTLYTYSTVLHTVQLYTTISVLPEEKKQGYPLPAACQCAASVPS